MSISEMPIGTPSRVEEKDPSVARIAGLAGLVFVLAGTVMQYWNDYGNSERPPFNPLLIRLWWVLGVGGMMFHAMRDRERSTRRSYGLMGYLLLVYGLMTVAVHVVRLLGNDIVGYVVVGLLGLLSAAVTAAPFVREESREPDSESDATSGFALVACCVKRALGYFPRWLSAFRSSSLVQQVTLAVLTVALVGGIVGYSVTQISSVPFGVGGMLLGFLFLLAYSSREGEAAWRDASVYVVGLAGLLAALGAGGPVFAGPLGVAAFGLPLELVLGTLAIVFLGAFIGMKSSDSTAGHGMAVVLFWLGVIGALGALARSIIPAIQYEPANLRVPLGFLGVVLGGLAAAIGATLAFDNRLLTMTRRELAAYFYSPIAYIVIAGMALIAWAALMIFISMLVPGKPEEGPPPTPPLVAEPLIRHYYYSLPLVLCVVMFLPGLTMRLLSEESRSGTLEVLLTAPVNEWLVVLSKFFASWLVCMLSWLPWVVFPLCVRFVADEQFDTRPIMSFFAGVSLICAAFLSMGLFFSSITKNQIVAFILTASGTLIFTLFYVGRGLADQQGWGPGWRSLMAYFDYITLLDELVQGKVPLHLLFFYLSVSVLFLFITVKVLEARRWK